MLGKTSGNQPRQSSQERLNQETFDAIEALREAVQQLLLHSRQGPDWERSFRLPASGTCADLTTPFQMTIVHDFGYIPDHFVITRIASSVAAGTQPAALGMLRVISSTDRTMTFQADGAAVTGQSVFFVCPYRESFVPLDVAQEDQSQFGFGGNRLQDVPVTGSKSFLP